MKGCLPWRFGSPGSGGRSVMDRGNVESRSSDSRIHSIIIWLENESSGELLKIRGQLTHGDSLNSFGGQTCGQCLEPSTVQPHV